MPLDSPQLCPLCGKLRPDVASPQGCPHCFEARQTPLATDHPLNPALLEQINNAPPPIEASVPQQSVPSAQEPTLPSAILGSNVSRHAIFRNRRSGLCAVAFIVFVAAIAFVFSHRERAATKVQPAQSSSHETAAVLATRYVGNGTRLLDEGDNFGALIWFAEALKLHRGIPDEEANDRFRIGSTLRHSPKLLQVWSPGPAVNSAEFSSDGRLVLAAVGTNAVWVWNIQTGKAEHSPFIHKGNRPIEAHFSPDSQTIVSVTGDSACLWSTKTGERLRSFTHFGAIHAVFDPEGALLATASRDGSVKIWNLGDAGRQDAICTLPPRKPIVSLCFSPDSKALLTGEEAGAVHIWDIGEGPPASASERFPAWKPEGALRYAAFDCDGSRVVTVHAGGTARIWDAANGSALSSVLRQSNGLTRATFSPDGRWLATAGECQLATIWNAETGIPAAQLSGHRDVVTSSCFSPSGYKIITASLDGTARIFESASGKVLTPPLRHGAAVTAATFHPDGQRFLTAGADGIVRVWSLWSERQLLPFSDDLGTRIVAVTPDRSTAVVQDSSYSLQLWDAASWKATSVLIPAGNLVTYACVGDDRAHLLSAAPTRGSNGFDFIVKTWELPSGREVSSITVAGDYSLNPLVVSSDCKRIALRRGKTVEVLDAATATPVFRAVSFPDRPAVVRFSRDSRYLLIAAGCKLQAFDVATGKAMFSPLKHSCMVSDAVFSHDGTRIVSSCSDDSVNPGQAQLWDMLSGKAIGKPMKQTSGILHVNFSADDRLIITASKDNTARVWDASTSQPVGSPLRHPATVSDSSFSPDRRWIATASHDKTARVWDAKTAEPLTPRLKHNQYVDEVLLLAGGHHLLTRSILKSKVWELPSDNRSPADLQILAEVLSGCRVENGRTLVPLEPSVLADSWNRLRRKYDEEFTFATFEGRKKIPARDSHAGPTLLDLTASYNALLTEPRHAGASANDFAGLPQGLQIYTETEFDVRGVVQLAGGDLPMHGGRSLPEAVQKIRVDQTVSRIHLLHGASFYERDRTAVAYLRVHYEDGKVQELPILAGIDVEGSTEWARELTLTHAELAWPRPGDNTPRNRSQPARLYKSSWDNPVSDVLVKSIDYVSTMSRAAPYLVAITVEP